MRLLLVCATNIEAKQIITELEMRKVSDFLYASEEFNTYLLITGIGSVATVFAMLSQRSISMYDFLINFGISGSFSKNYKIGNLYNVTSDYFGDIGINAENGFKQVFKTEFNAAYSNLINNGRLYNTSDFPPFFRDLDKLRGVTVSEPERQYFQDADIETMEGSAFMLVAKYYKKMFVQISGISNIIGITKRKDWDINTPIHNYSNLIIDFIKKNKA
ncbi:MAG: hypothetical protein C0596_14640 [Marinilabiliales bacterium]|nr:MAG: hypothetical protein C0596_14640 [Marinilabiliales bacterium]